MQYKVLLTGILMVGLLAGNAHAEGLKIAYVDTLSAIVNTTAYKNGIKRLNEKRNRIQKELKALSDKIRKARADLEGKAMAMKPERLAQLQEEISQMQKQGSRKAQDAEEEIRRENQRLLQGLGADFDAAVRKYGKEHGYDLILRKKSAVYGASHLDITAEITKLINAKK